MMPLAFRRACDSTLSRWRVGQQGPHVHRRSWFALRSCAFALEQLAVSIEEWGESNAAAVNAEPSVRWPEIMSTKLAASYCGYRTTGGLRKAHLDRKVFPVGRGGGAGSCTTRRLRRRARIPRGQPTLGATSRSSAIRGEPSGAAQAGGDRETTVKRTTPLHPKRRELLRNSRSATGIHGVSRCTTKRLIQLVV